MSHLRDSASWIWPGAMCWHRSFVGRTVQISETQEGVPQGHRPGRRDPGVAIVAKRTHQETKKDHTEAEMHQMEIAIYVKARCRRCWRARRLLRRRGYAFEAIDVSGDDELHNWLVETTGSKTVPQVFVDGRLVGGFAVVRALDISGDLERLVRGAV